MLRYILLVGILLSFVALTLPTSQIFQEVVETPAYPLTNLRQHTKTYLTETAEQWQANADSTLFTTENDLLLYNRQSVKHPIGQVTYRVSIDLKEEKYRYTIDSAFFRAYHRNRYSRYVPQRGAAIPYQQAQATFSAKDRARYEKQLLKKINSRFQSFRSFLSPPPPTPPKTEDTW